MKNSKQQTTNNKQQTILHHISTHNQTTFLTKSVILTPHRMHPHELHKEAFYMHRLSGCVLCSPTTAVHVTERKRADGAIMRRHTSQEYITDPVPYSSVQNPPDRDHGFISRISDLDTGTLRTGMHDTSVSDIKRHMPCIADHISGLCIRIGNFCSRALQCPGSSRDRNAK